MDYKIICYKNYLLAIDDTEVKSGDHYINLENNSVYIKNMNIDTLSNEETTNSIVKKIIAHLPPNVSCILKGIDLLPKLKSKKDVVEEICVDILRKEGKWSHLFINDYPSKPYPKNFESDLDKVKVKYYESNIYIEHEIRTLVHSSIEFLSHNEPEEFEEWFERKLELYRVLSIPVGFKCDREDDLIIRGESDPFNNDDGKKINLNFGKVKITKNEQDQVVWSGKYIY